MNNIRSIEMELTTRSAKQATGERRPVWSLAYLEAAEKDARRFLSEEQYAHAVGLMDELAHEVNPRLSETQDVQAVEGFYELRDKGGVLGKINLRVYFLVEDDHKVIVAIACDKKEQENKIALHMLKRIRNRAKIARSLLKTSGVEKPERN